MKNVLFIIAFCFSCLANAQTEPQPVYIDVRTWIEHQVDHIEGDPRIHHTQIVKGVEKNYPDKNTAIRLYCEVGVRSGNAVERLRQAGYLNVENAGGIDDVRMQRNKRKSAVD